MTCCDLHARSTSGQLVPKVAVCQGIWTAVPCLVPVYTVACCLCVGGTGTLADLLKTNALQLNSMMTCRGAKADSLSDRLVLEQVL